MMRALLCLMVVGLIAACGVDGAPKPPAKSGLTLSGQVKMGVSGSL